jgi:hypothetical protein
MGKTIKSRSRYFSEPGRSSCPQISILLGMEQEPKNSKSVWGIFQSKTIISPSIGLCSWGLKLDGQSGKHFRGNFSEPRRSFSPQLTHISGEPGQIWRTSESVPGSFHSRDDHFPLKLRTSLGNRTRSGNPTVRFQGTYQSLEFGSRGEVAGISISILQKAIKLVKPYGSQKQCKAITFIT